MTSAGEPALGRFLQELSAGTPAPGGGSAAAAAVAMAASLCAMAARFSEPSGTNGDLVRRAEALRDTASALCEQDLESYRPVLEALRPVAGEDPPSRRARVAVALSQASEVPLRIAETGAAVARLAASLAASGNPHLAGDSLTAALLAAAGARAAAALVELNLAGSAADSRLARVGALVDGAQAAVGAAQSCVAGRRREDRAGR